VKKSTIMAAPTLMSTDEYLRTPESMLPAELAYGVYRVAEAPTPRHQSIVLDVAAGLREHVKRRDLGRVWVAPVDVILDRRRALVVQPDLIVVSNHRLRIVTDRVWGPPDLVVEVLSPHPRIGRLEERLEWFATYGVRECWLVRHLAQQLDIVSFADKAIAERRTLDLDDPIRSTFLPEFTPTLRTLIDWEGY
jgi:Uma2 family endonuclease